MRPQEPATVLTVRPAASCAVTYFSSKLVSFAKLVAGHEMPSVQRDLHPVATHSRPQLASPRPVVAASPRVGKEHLWNMDNRSHSLNPNAVRWFGLVPGRSPAKASLIRTVARANPIRTPGDSLSRAAGAK